MSGNFDVDENEISRVRVSETLMETNMDDSRVSTEDKFEIMHNEEVVSEGNKGEIGVLESLEDKDLRVSALDNRDIGENVAEKVLSEESLDTGLDKRDFGENVGVIEECQEEGKGDQVASHSIETKASDGFREQDVSKGTHTEISFDESNMGSLIVDLDSSFGPNGTESEVKDDHTEEGDRVGKQIAGVERPKEGKFPTMYDLVWGKVKSHPWWPGQIFDPSNASKKAMKLYKKGRFLVAYFGDQTFAWNDALSLRPFKDNFSQMEKQTNIVAFHDAVNCALEEVARRVELGLSCSCTPEEIHAVMKSQVVMNAGIREKVCKTDGMDKFYTVEAFEPKKLVKYIKTLAAHQGDGVDRMELVIARSQLVGFYSSKGYFQLPEIYVSEALSDNAEHTTPDYKNKEKAPIGEEKLRSQRGTLIKRQDMEDDLKSGKKEKSLAELMDRKRSLPCEGNGAEEKDANKSACPSFAKKRRVIESSSNNTKTKRDSDTEATPSRDPKVGQRIRSIARQLAGSPPVLRTSGDRFLKSDVKLDGRSKNKLHEVDVITHIAERTLPKKYSSPDEMLSQLCLAARDPMKGYSFLTTIVGFFTDFRNSTSLDCSLSMKLKKCEKKMCSGKTSITNRKPSNSRVRSTESHGAVSDSYWPDMIIQSSPEEELPRRKQKRKAESPVEIPLTQSPTFGLKTSHNLNSISEFKKDTSTVEPVNSFELNLTVDSKQQGPDGNGNLVIEKSVDNKKNLGEFSPTALILNFTDANSIPLESDLNRIFTRFGSLKESETEILRRTKRARVVFEKPEDANEAFKKGTKFSVFGPALVSYELKSLPSPSKASPCTKKQSREDATSLEGNTD